MGAFGRFCVRLSAILAVMVVAACSQPAATVEPNPTASSSIRLSIKDNGSAFTYSVAGYFSVFLNSDSYPKGKFTCTPDNVIKEVAGTTGIYDIETGLYGVSFQGAQVGTCTLTNNDFSVTITIVE